MSVNPVPVTAPPDPLVPLHTPQPRSAGTEATALGLLSRRKARFWDRIARRYAASAITDMAGYERTLARTRSWLSPDSRVLEIGCGTGTSALRLASDCGLYLATDVSPGMIGIARAKLAAQPLRQLTFALADADRLPGAAIGPFDVVLAFNVLHLVDDLDAAVAGAAAALSNRLPCQAE